MKTGLRFRPDCRVRLILLAAILSFWAARPAAVYCQEDKALVESVRKALRGDKIDRQHAALALIPELGRRQRTADGFLLKQRRVPSVPVRSSG